MNFFSLTIQKFCSSIFPSLQDLLSHQLLIGTMIFYPYLYIITPLIKQLNLAANTVKTQNMTVRYGVS